MTVITPDLRKIAMVSVALALLLFAVLTLIVGYSPENVLLKSGFIISIVAGYWAFFIKYGWEYPILRMWGWLSDIPNLNGRYEGRVERRGEGNPHKFVMEINQTFRTLSINTYSQNSRGQQVTANIVRDAVGRNYIIYTWQCRTRKLDGSEEKEDFFGTSVISVTPSDEGTILEDEYYTRRNPPTRGETRLKFVSRELKHCYD